MSDWQEKEWDEPGPDFGKVFYRRRPPITRPRPVNPPATEEKKS